MPYNCKMTCYTYISKNQVATANHKAVPRIWLGHLPDSGTRLGVMVKYGLTHIHPQPPPLRVARSYDTTFYMYHIYYYSGM